ncbi:DUF6056 family protein [Hymenobacter monticola]|uniref:DUF6056 family protein n=1 Tax=Hymenobacter monticola TaxID=1705399 RepID=A0ABY4BB40_9BACT|nr:DUF6056 family protein [Hymenobacter monticola]UOE36342.1 DUF6056 family protein [Hymenobacter monticola]
MQNGGEQLAQQVPAMVGAEPDGREARERLVGGKGAVALLVTAGACLLPFLCLAFYAHPYLDDFVFPATVRQHGVWQHVATTYGQWSGRFSSSLVTALHPLAWGGLGAYQPFVFGLILFFAASVAFAGWNLLGGGGVPARVRLAAGSLFLVPFLLLLPSPTEAFYWATSALAYTLATACCLVLLGALARLASAERAGARAVWWALALMVAALAPGFSEIIGCFVLALLLVLAPQIWQRRLAGAPLALLLLAVGAAAVATLAPGNFARQAASLHPHLPLGRSLGLAAVALGYSLYGWLANGFVILLTLLVLPALQRLAGRAQLPLVRLARWVWVWPTWLFLGLLLCYVFSYVAVGTPPPSRARNVLVAFFLVGWLMSWVGLLAHRQRRGLAPLPTLPAYGRAALLALLGLLIASDHNSKLKREAVGTPTNSVAQAYRDWLSGDAARYDREEEARYQLIRSTPAKSVEIQPLRVKPETLFWWDISTNPTLWGNRAYAAFFNKQAIWTAPAPPGKPNKR